MFAAPAADPDLAQDQICDDAEDRQRHDDDDPGKPRRGLPMGPEQDAREDGEVCGSDKEVDWKREVQSQV
jgi:hypothetical protein